MSTKTKASRKKTPGAPKTPSSRVKIIPRSAPRAPRPRAPRARRGSMWQEEQEETRGRVVSSNYNQTGALGAATQITPAFPGVLRPYRVQAYPREYANLSAATNPGIPVQTFLQQPGPPQQVAPSATFNKMMEEYTKMLQLQGQSAQYVAPQVEVRGMAQANVPQLREPGTTAFADVPDRAVAPIGQAMAVFPLVQRQAFGSAAQARPAETSVNQQVADKLAREQQFREQFVRQAARIQDWNQRTYVPPSSRGSVVNSMADVIRVMGSEYRSQPPTTATVFDSDTDTTLPTTATVFDSDTDTTVVVEEDPFAEFGGLLGLADCRRGKKIACNMSGGAVDGAWYTGTTPTMLVAGDKRLMSQYGPQVEAQRHMEQRVDYLGYVGTGLVRTTPVYQAGDVGWAEPPVGAQTIRMDSKGGRAAVAIVDPNSHKVGQTATTAQTPQQQYMATLYEQRGLLRPQTQVSGQPYFSHDVTQVIARPMAAGVMPSSIYSKLEGSRQV